MSENTAPPVEVKPVGLTHVDLDRIGDRFYEGRWDDRDVRALFVEIARLNAIVDAMRDVLRVGGAL